MDFIPASEIRKPERLILHIDLDAFFAACEEARNPKLKGKPVIIGADPKNGKGRGVVSTANYKAREFGIKSAMPISWAYKRCPSGIFLPVDMKYYSQISDRIMKIIRKYSKKFEQVGIDEAYIDVSGKDYKEAKEIANQIKKEIYEKEMLTCSIGISPNKLISKIASDFKKPNGITIVKQEDIENFISEMSVRKLYGVGPKTEKKLLDIGIKKVKDLQKADIQLLREYFGNTYALYLRQIASGIDKSELSDEWEAKSTGRMHTFEKDTNDEKEIYSRMNELIDDIFNGTCFKTLTIRVRYSNFETHTKQRTGKSCLTLAGSKKLAKELLDEYLDDRKIRLIGVSFSSFIKDQTKLEEY